MEEIFISRFEAKLIRDLLLKLASPESLQKNPELLLHMCTMMDASPKNVITTYQAILSKLR